MRALLNRIHHATPALSRSVVLKDIKPERYPFIPKYFRHCVVIVLATGFFVVFPRLHILKPFPGEEQWHPYWKDKIPPQPKPYY